LTWQHTASQPAFRTPVEYNEDLSAFHGPTLDSETAYAADAVRYILSLYPVGTEILILGHSMGGIAAVSLLGPFIVRMVPM
jgi:GPI inositol-deacylase